MTSQPDTQYKDTGRLLVSIIMYRDAQLTLDCLHSIEQEIAHLPGSRVVVVDNGSGGDEAEFIETAIKKNDWSAWARLVRSEINRGFAAGNNIVLRENLAAEDPAEFVLLLNPDTLVRPGAFRELLAFMDEHPKVGIAGSRCEDPDGTPQVCCFRFPNMFSELALYLRMGIVDRLLHRRLTKVPFSDEAHPIDWVSGASMIMRERVVREIGLMDEAYFLYYEETDFSLRAQKMGWECWHVPSSHIVHLVGQSTGVSLRTDAPKRRPTFWFDSRRRFFLKHYGILYSILTDLLSIGGFSLWRLRRVLQRKPDLDPPHFLKDLIRHSVFGSGFSVADEKTEAIQDDQDQTP